MRTGRTGACSRKSSALLLGLAVLCPLVVFGQSGSVTTPLHVNASSSIADEFGAKLRGSLNHPGALVQVLSAPDGIIYPPLMDGRPDPRNALLERGTTRIGALTSPLLADEGLFGHSIASPRPAGGTRIFVRVFNAPNMAEASFYGDSQVFTVEDNKVFNVRIARTDKDLDPADLDGDGLSNSWEKSLDTDPGNPDTDGDGMLDGEEFLAGTDSKDSSSMLQIARIVGFSGGGFDIAWDSVPGRQYRVEFTPHDLAGGEVVFSNASDVVAAVDTQTVHTVNVPGAAYGYFRVYLVVE